MIGHGSGAAVDALSAAVSAEPGRGDLWSELATALVAAGRAPEAWYAALRGVELAPRSAASHRAIGMVAAALGDPAQAESAYRHASLLDAASSAGVPSDVAAASRGRHASDRATALAAWMASQIAVPDPRPPADSHAAPPANGSRHAAAEHPPAIGRHGVPELSPGGDRAPQPDPTRPGTWPLATPSTGGRRRAPEGDPTATAVPAGTAAARDGGGLATAVWGAAAPGGRAAWTGEVSGKQAQRTAVGLPGWLGPVGPTPGPDGWARVASRGATRLADPVAWRRGLIAVVRIEWLVGVVSFLGLAYGRTAPYTAGLLAVVLVVAGAYGRLRWKSTSARRPPRAHRAPTYAAVAAAATAVVIIPAATAGALTLARVAAVAAVTCATVAAVLLARPVGKDIWP